MGIIERIAQIDKKFAWSFIGVLLALFGFWYFRENPANLNIEIISNARVYDVHEDVPQLEILFNGENIKQKKEVLSFVTVRFSNKGGKPITQNMYDASLPFGVKVSEGKIFPPNVLDASDDYLRKNLSPVTGSNNDVVLNKVVFDPGAFFTIKMLVLHSEGKDPDIVAEGKIAGIDMSRITSANTTKQAHKQTIFDFPFELVAKYGVGLLTGITILQLGFLIFKEFAETLSKRLIFKSRKEKLESAFLAFKNDADSNLVALLSDIALRNGRFGLFVLREIKQLGIPKPKYEILRRACDDTELRKKYDERPYYRRLPETLFIPLFDAQVFEENNDRMTFSNRFAEHLNGFEMYFKVYSMGMTSDSEPKEENVSELIDAFKSMYT